MFEDVLNTLETKSAAPLPDDDLVVQRDILAGAANVHLHHFSEAQAYLDRATSACTASTNLVCAEFFGVRGQSEIERGELNRALHSSNKASP